MLVEIYHMQLQTRPWLLLAELQDFIRSNSHHSPTLASISLQWRHNGRDGVSNHQPHYCLLNRLFRHKSKKTPKLRVTGLCEGNSPMTGEFPAQMASNAENVSIWWRHHVRAVCTGWFCFKTVVLLSHILLLWVGEYPYGCSGTKNSYIINEQPTGIQTKVLFFTVTTCNVKTLQIIAKYCPGYISHMQLVILCISWWRHQMETFSALLAFCAENSLVTGEFPIQRPVTRSFDVFLDLRPNTRMSKQWWGWWFETPSQPLWRHCNV